jgi:hypothetical protein
MSEKKTFGSLYKGRVVLRNGKEIEVWKKIQPKDKATLSDKASVATQPDTLRDTKESKDREGAV